MCSGGQDQDGRPPGKSLCVHVGQSGLYDVELGGAVTKGKNDLHICNFVGLQFPGRCLRQMSF